MHGSPNAQQLKSKSVVNLIDASIVNDSPFADQQIDLYDASQSATPESTVWNTSLLSQVRNFCFSLHESTFIWSSSAEKVILNVSNGSQNIVDRQ